MIIPQQALDLIKDFEGFRSEAYLCPAGIWTIGYGTTAGAGVGISPKPGDTISQMDAETLLIATLQAFGAKLRPMLTRQPSLTEWSAMLSLAYNIGLNGFRRSSVLRHYNAGNKRRALMHFCSGARLMERSSWASSAAGKQSDPCSSR